MPRKALPPRLVEKAGTWYVAFSEDGRSQRQSLRTDDLQTAQDRFQGWIESRKRFEAQRQAPDFKTAAKLYLEQHAEKRAAAPGTLHTVCKQLARFFGDMQLEQIRTKDVERYARERLAGTADRRAVSVGTVRKELTIMRAVFNFMVRRVEPPEYRADQRELCYIPIPSRPDPRNRVLSRDELQRIREDCRPPAPPARIPRLSRYLWLLMETGARAGALRELTWDQVDLEAGIIYLNPRGREQTKKRRPTVPISDDLLAILTRAKKERINNYVLDHTGQIRKSMERFTERLQLEGVTAHTFRHTFATHLAQHGVDMIQIAQLLGDSLATVEKNYLHLSPQYLRGAIGALSQARGFSDVRNV